MGCGGPTPRAIAGQFDAAIDATKPVVTNVSEPQAESAARRATCRGLNAYSSTPATALSEQLRTYAQAQQITSSTGLTEVGAADRLAAAASGVETTQQAAEVASILGCR